jgi:uncharacterized iron-regulated membrane protein
MKKILRKLHLWLSLPFGILVSVICFSGAVLVFEAEIIEVCYPSRYFADEVMDKPLPIEQLIERVNRQLPDTLSVASLQISADQRRNYQVGFGGRNRLSAFVNPYTGELKEVYNPQGNFFSVMRQLHRWLLDDFRRDGSFSLGKTLVGITTMVFVFVLLSGFVVWLPKSKRLFSRSLKIRIKSTWKRLLYDLHVTLGVYSFLILLALALTGLTWSFAWYRDMFYGAFGLEFPQMTHGASGQQNLRSQPTDRHDRILGSIGHRRSGRAQPSDAFRRDHRRVDFVYWQKAVDQVKNKRLDFNLLSVQDGRISVPASPSNYGNTRASDVYLFDSRTGEITDVILYEEQAKAMKLRGWIYSIHVGSWGGILSRILTFLASLFGATLPLSGYYLWIKRLLLSRKNRR